MRLSLLTGAAVLLAPALAAAGAPHQVKPSGEAGMFDIVVGAPTIDELQFARQVLPPSNLGPGTSAVAQSRTVYLNKGGVTLLPGDNDSRTNHSSIPTAQTVIPPWNVSATTWSATVSCMRELFSAYDVTITDVNPGNVPHIEAVFGGSPTLLGMGTNVGGVSPFTTDCSIIENAIVFTFTAVIPQDARTACEIMAQEVAHAYGLDHELLASDPMTYLTYNANRSFQNQTASCGEDVTRVCGINGSTCRPNQNSVALLTERLGVKGAPGDSTPPIVGITSPANNATVPPGFTVSFTASDASGVKMASVYIDGVASGSTTVAPYTIATPAGTAEGKHTIRVEVTDGTNKKFEDISVTVRKGATPPSGDGSVDVEGGCSTGGGSSLLVGLGLLGLAIRRRR